MKPYRLHARPTFARLALGALVIACPAWLAACAGEDPAAPASTDVRTARGGKGGGGGSGPGPVVVDAVPSKVPQGVILDVHVLGSDFEDGSVVDLLIDGNTTNKVQTNSTTFVSDTELVANISVAADADLTLYDVRVTSPGRKKKGVGLDLLEVIPGPQATLPTCTFDGEACDSATPPGVYEDGGGVYLPADGLGGDVYFASNGNLRVDPQCDSGREILLVLPDPTVPANAGWALSGPPSTCNGRKEGFVRLQIPGLFSAGDGPIGEPPEPPDYSPSVFFFFEVPTSGGKGNHRDQYNVVWTDAAVRVLARRPDGTPFRWHVTGSQAELYLRPGDQANQPQGSGGVRLDLTVTLVD